MLNALSSRNGQAVLRLVVLSAEPAISLTAALWDG